MVLRKQRVIGAETSRTEKYHTNRSSLLSRSRGSQERKRINKQRYQNVSRFLSSCDEISCEIDQQLKASEDWSLHREQSSHALNLTDMDPFPYHIFWSDLTITEWFGLEGAYLVPTHLPWAGTPPTRPGITVGAPSWDKKQVLSWFLFLTGRTSWIAHQFTKGWVHFCKDCSGSNTKHWAWWKGCWVTSSGPGCAGGRAWCWSWHNLGWLLPSGELWSRAWKHQRSWTFLRSNWICIQARLAAAHFGKE